jgi:hypothetical protein
VDRFLQEVQKSLGAMGWGSAAAKVQINFDPDYLLELQTEGMSASDAAIEVERQYKSRHSQST